MIPIPKPPIQRAEHRLHRLGHLLPDLRLHPVPLMLLHQILEGDIERAKLLLDRIALLGIQALHDGRGIGAGGRARRRPAHGLGGMLHVQQMLGRVLPGVRVHLLGVLAPGGELGRGGGAEFALQVGLADHAIDDVDVVGEEDALQAAGAVDGAGPAVEVRDQRLERVAAVVLEELAAVGADVEGFERRDRGRGRGGRRVAGRGPAAVAERSHERGDGRHVACHGLEAGHGFGDDGNGAAVGRKI